MLEIRPGNSSRHRQCSHPVRRLPKTQIRGPCLPRQCPRPVRCFPKGRASGLFRARHGSAPVRRVLKPKSGGSFRARQGSDPVRRFPKGRADGSFRRPPMPAPRPPYAERSVRRFIPPRQCPRLVRLMPKAQIRRPILRPPMPAPLPRRAATARGGGRCAPAFPNLYKFLIRKAENGRTASADYFVTLHHTFTVHIINSKPQDV